MDDLLNECIRLASNIGDGDASVAIKRRKRDWNVLAFFNLTLNVKGKGTLGYINAAQDPMLPVALEKLRDKLVEFLAQREAAEAERVKAAEEAEKRSRKIPGTRTH